MDKNKPHKRIWLLDDYWDGEPCHVWCEDPAPGLDQDPKDAIGPYIYTGDLAALVERMEAKCPTQSDVVYDHMIHAGRQDVIRAIKELIGG